MPFHCCVPGCRGNYSKTKETSEERVSVFKFPTDVALRNKWIRAIPRANLEVSNNTVVCEKHFSQQFISRVLTATRDDGTVLTVPRKYPKLSDDAYPSLFPNTPAYLSEEPPIKRINPDSRREEMMLRDEQNFQDWMSSDNVLNFTNLSNRCSKFLKDYSEWITHEEKNTKISLCKIDFSEAPVVTVGIIIDQSLNVTVFNNGIKLDDTSLTWILGNELKLTKWSQLTTLLTHFSGVTSDSLPSIMDIVSDIRRKFDDLSQVLNNNCCNETEIINDDLKLKLNFVIDQFSLLFVSQRRYSVQTTMFSFHLLCLSSCAYNFIRDRVLTLPHVSHLRRLSQTLSITSDAVEGSHASYLRKKLDLLSESEHNVILMLDEIHVAPKITYKNGVLSGLASNTPYDEATSVQAFMISSLLSSNKDVVALLPVKNLTSNYLKECTMKVLSMLETIGYRVICLISDNNRVNRNMFTAMCNGILKPSIENPFDSSRQLFFLFDSVHLIKCIRNNWLGQSDSENTFAYPDFHDESQSLRKASLSHLRKLHNSEKDNIVKMAPSLTHKALHPSSLERQNVNLALKLFDEKLPTALNEFAIQMRNSNFNDTADFITIVAKLWKILNVKTCNKGLRKKDDSSLPILSDNDERVMFLRRFSSWLERWESLHQKPRQGRLTNETLFALKHTVITFPLLISHLFERFNLSYVLTGKFQTDCLESRFGKYRQLAGSNYNVSVQEIRDSEKKLRILNVLHVLSDSKGEITLTDFLSADDDSDSENMKCFNHLDEIEKHNFSEVIAKCSEYQMCESQYKSLIFISGYVAFKMTGRLKCNLCANELTSFETLELEKLPTEFSYLASIDRGGLKWPSEFLVSIVCEMFSVFSVLICKQFESKFLQVVNQLNVLMHLSLIRLEKSDMMYTDVCECGCSSLELCKMCMKPVANIFLNNYSKRACDNKLASKNLKRKLLTLTK